VKKLLVCANETVGGRALIEAVKRHAAQDEVTVWVVCPQNQPRHGLVIDDHTVRQAAENRLRTTLAQLEREGIDARGDVMDPDPFHAVTDAAREFEPDEIIISTHPATRSGWLRRVVLVGVVVGWGVGVVVGVVVVVVVGVVGSGWLVVANQTVGGEPLFGLLRGKAQEKPHQFIVFCPQSADGDGDPHARLDAVIKRLEGEGYEAIGQVMDRDPFTAIQNALQFYSVDEIVISTFPATRSGWLRSDLVQRVRGSTAKPVEHVVVSETVKAEEIAA
jgi:hypothetical protein